MIACMKAGNCNQLHPVGLLSDPDIHLLFMSSQDINLSIKDFDQNQSEYLQISNLIAGIQV